MVTNTEMLCRGFPTEFVVYMNYVRSLRFDDKPDYSYLRKIFRDLFLREGISTRGFGFFTRQVIFTIISLIGRYGIRIR